METTINGGTERSAELQSLKKERKKHVEVDETQEVQRVIAICEHLFGGETKPAFFEDILTTEEEKKIAEEEAAFIKKMEEQGKMSRVALNEKEIAEFEEIIAGPDLTEEEEQKRLGQAYEKNPDQLPSPQNALRMLKEVRTWKSRIDPERIQGKLEDGSYWSGNYHVAWSIQTGLYHFLPEAEAGQDAFMSFNLFPPMPNEEEKDKPFMASFYMKSLGDDGRFHGAEYQKEIPPDQAGELKDLLYELKLTQIEGLNSPS